MPFIARAGFPNTPPGQPFQAAGRPNSKLCHSQQSPPRLWAVSGRKVAALSPLGCKTLAPVGALLASPNPLSLIN